MKRFINILWVIVFILFVFSCKEDQTVQIPNIEMTGYEVAVWKSLNSQITPITGSSPSLNNSDLSALDLFAGATILGLGEASHGSKEFFQMKHRIFKYFVEKHRFRIFAFEADMGECIYVDRFITKGESTIEEVMNKMHFWTWKTEEVKELILWMKNYNLGKIESEKIHLLGVDCQYITYNEALLKEYLAKYDADYPMFIDPILRTIGSMAEKQRKGIAVDATERISLQKRCDSLTTYFNTNKERLIVNSGKTEYDLISRLVKQTQQWVNVKTITTFSYRDLHMAENTVWLSKLFGNPTKTVCWAHNGHVAKNTDYGMVSQGYIIQKELNYEYKVIGFSFNFGSFRAMNQDLVNKTYTGLIVHTISKSPLRDSYNYILQAADYKNFILINSTVPVSDPLYNWLNSPRKMLSVGAVFNTSLYDEFCPVIKLGSIYDAIIHIDNISASVGI